MPSTSTTTEPLSWALAVTHAARHEFAALIAALPDAERTAVGELKHWSPKDEIAHLAYWIEVFVSNIQAQREGRPLIDTRPYLAMNDAAWEVRRAWTWGEVEAATAATLGQLEMLLQNMSADDLTDPQRFTIEPLRTAPRPLIRSLLYELVDHPVHHFTGLYRKISDPDGMSAMLVRYDAVLQKRGTSQWTATTRKKIKAAAQALSAS
ncbi:MAG: DinB family protein [Chloroflexota bacterium]|nr:DinB family protein [Chloroflexota bacterium]